MKRLLFCLTVATVAAVTALAETQDFPINIGDTVSDLDPGGGSGNIEESWAVDRYTFSGVAGQRVCLRGLAAVGCGSWWSSV